MNGRFAWQSDDFPLSNQDMNMSQATTSRLPMAVLVSCLLHAFIIVLPYFGHSIARPKRLGTIRGPATFSVTFAGTNSSGRSTTTSERPAAVDIAMQPTPDTGQYKWPGSASTGQSGNGYFADVPQKGSENAQPPAPLVAYYPIERLTKRPQPTKATKLDAPAISPIVASGKIVMKLWISEWGDVHDAVVEKTDLPEKFSETAIAVMKQLKFTPGEFYGQRVAVIMKIEISYDDFRVPPH